jgi:hypothetical protein
MERPTTESILEILERVEETLAGLVHLEKQGILDNESQVKCVLTLSVAVLALDLYLTGKVENRGKKDHLDAAPLLAGQPWIAELSDGWSALVLRKPTKEDRRMVFLDENTSDRPPDEKVKSLWDTLVSLKKPPVKFPINDGLFE